MKRIVGRKMGLDQTNEYPSYKVLPLNIDALPTGMPFRFRWASDIIDDLKKSGVMCRNFLDIGAYDGYLAAVVAKKRFIETEVISVDAVEAHKSCFESAEILAKSATSKGLKLKIHNVRFEDYKTDTVYDIITAFEVLEHTLDPLFCIEKIYELLEIGGHLMLTVPEESGKYGLSDNNRLHHWTSTVQSLVFMFHDDRKWKIKSVFEEGGLLHALIQKRSYQGG